VIAHTCAQPYTLRTAGVELRTASLRSIFTKTHINDTSFALSQSAGQYYTTVSCNLKKSKDVCIIIATVQGTGARGSVVG
jgi:hypothetical protein